MSKQKKILVTGAGGFIATHLIRKLKKDGYFVVGVDIKRNEFIESEADFFIIQDLTDQTAVDYLFKNFQFTTVFNLAAVMGGMEFLANGIYDYIVLSDSTKININVIDSAIKYKVDKIFFSSSACVYNQQLQETSDNVSLKESDAYPAWPDLEYGYQKLITERLYIAGERCNKIETRIARFHNVYGEYTEYETDKAKAPAALCRKIAIANDGDEIEVWGDGLQTRSFMYASDCITGVLKLMDSSFNEPINIGSDELISINDLASLIIKISGKKLTIKNINGPQGVRGRNSNNDLIKAKLNWSPEIKLEDGIRILYNWVNKQVNK